MSHSNAHEFYEFIAQEYDAVKVEPIIEDNDICTCGKLIVLVQDDVDCVGDPPRMVASYVWQHEDGTRACKDYEP